MIRRIGLAPLLSGALSLGLAALLATSLSAPRRNWEAGAPPAPAAVAPPAAATAPVPVRIDRAETLARPLFAPSRRPPPAAPVAGLAGAAAPAALANMTLLGTIVGPGARIAIIRAPNAQAAQRLLPGQSAGGWEIVDITRDRVVLRAGGTERELAVPPPSQTSGTSHPASRSPSPALPR